jgi:vacuolar-type H+-ATPase subunit I/STV1
MDVYSKSLAESSMLVEVIGPVYKSSRVYVLFIVIVVVGIGRAVNAAVGTMVGRLHPPIS